MTAPRWVVGIPVPLRQAVVGAVLLGVPGCMAGLIIGLRANTRTAWFATFELGIPAALAGFVLGLLIGSVIFVAGRAARRSKAG